MPKLTEEHSSDAQNFKIKNGLSVGSTEVIDSSGDLTNAGLSELQNFRDN